MLKVLELLGLLLLLFVSLQVEDELDELLDGLLWYFCEPVLMLLLSWSPPMFLSR